METEARLQVRVMTVDDIAPVSQLAARLVAMHHGLDGLRFMELPNAAEGYASYFATELRRESEVVLLVACLQRREFEPGEIVGYAYARLESRSYNELLDACGKLHDVYVDESARGRGIGEALVALAIRKLTELGAPRVVLLTASQNEAAQRLFARLGFRTTMLEMTREASSLKSGLQDSETGDG